ncbi:unnamed protein product [Clonostachys byssicola]|uniref:SET domain-containing protein n=1 Tax=Clonostachys byssicola TaxID=160290 RepID=A0A9N9UGX4_9HYPO|nr:unnamed protein product [Clonostachys byssicola]
MPDNAYEDLGSSLMSDESWSPLSLLDEELADGFRLYSSTSSDTVSTSAPFSDAASSDQDSANEADYIDYENSYKGARSPAHIDEGPYSSQKLLSSRDIVESLSSRFLFENDCFEVRPYSMSGVGGFARRDLAPGEVVLLEQPILRSNYDNLFRDFQRLDASSRNVFLQLYASDHFEPKRVTIEAIWSTNWSVLVESHVPALTRRHSILTKSRSRSFSINPDCQGLFAVASRFNHACAPSHNLEYRFDPTTGCMIFSVGAEPIKDGDELTISYGFGLRPIDLYRYYGFRCLCGACAGLTDEEISMSSIW